MEFEQFMRIVEEKHAEWINDEELEMHYSGDVEQITKEFINTIQKRIKADFVVMTKEEYKNSLERYHNSMEGLEQFNTTLRVLRELITIFTIEIKTQKL